MSDMTLLKRGETVIYTRFTRSKGGIRLFIKTHPSIEDLMQGWAQGEKVSIAEYGGRNWKPIDPKTKLMVWHIPNKKEPVNLGTFQSTISNPGGPLWRTPKEVGAGTNVGEVNFSFIRLVGVGEPEGVSFDINGAHSLEYLKDLNSKFKDAGKRFFQDYLLPVDLSVSVITQSL